MKIKEVCTQTGLTDRTVRYYIEEGLIAPSFTENYLGRKSFNFSEKDVAALHDIAVLRAYGFSVEQIRELIGHPENSLAIIRSAKARAAEGVVEQQKCLAALTALSDERVYTLSTLAHAISTPAPAALPDEKSEKKPRPAAILRLTLRVCAVWLPVLLTVLLLIIRVSCTPHPVFHPLFLILLGLSCLPSVLAMLPFKGARGARAKQILIGACTVCIPLSALCALGSVSECVHTWSGFTTETVVTCESEGTLVRTCAGCGARDTVAVKKLPHTIVHYPGQIPTCSSFGRTESQYCTACHRYILASETLPKSAHDYEEPYYRAATCSTRGGMAHKCRTCGKIELFFPTEEPNGAAHQFKEVLFDDDALGAPATHGELYYRCALCGQTACEIGNLNENVQYYITGDVVTSHHRNLIIGGTGEMPDFSEQTPPPWMDSIYLGEVRLVIIERGVKRIGAYAFASPTGAENPYKGIEKLILRSPDIHLPNKHLGGISNVVDEAFTERHQSPEAVASFLRFIKNETSKGGTLNVGNPDQASFCFYDLDGDGQEELLLRTGTCEADTLLLVYAYRTSRVVALGYVNAAHTVFYGHPEGTGAILRVSHQGEETFSHLQIAGDTLATDAISPDEVPNGLTQPKQYALWQADRFGK